MDSGARGLGEISEISVEASEQTKEISKAGMRFGFLQCDKCPRKAMRSSLKEGRRFLTFPSMAALSIPTVL